MNIQEWIFVVTFCIKGMKCCKIRPSFSRRFHRPDPTDNAIRALMNKFFKELGLCVTRSGRPRAARESIQSIREMFEENPTLSVRFLCLEFHIKSKVYRGRIQDTSDLKRRIREAVNEITPEMFANVFHNATDRFEICWNTDGALVESNKVLFCFKLGFCM